MFIIEKTMPNGAIANYHVVAKYEVHPGAVYAIVNSYASETREMISWQDTYTFPTHVFQIESLDDVEVFLTATGAPFEGGIIIPEEAATLDEQKARKRARLKLKRDQVDWGGVATPNGVVDSDAESKIKILGAFVVAQSKLAMGEPHSVDWRFSDNSVVTLDAQAVMVMGAAVYAHTEHCQAVKNALDAAIDAATTVEELDAVDIETGW